MIFVDSSVFLVDLLYVGDLQHSINAGFLRRMEERGDGAVTLMSLMEVAGILSPSLTAVQLKEFLVYFPTRYNLRVVPPFSHSVLLPPVPVGKLMDYIQRRSSVGDALALWQLERYAPAESALVTWDAEHFEGKTALPVLTPRSFLKNEGILRLGNYAGPAA